MTKEALINQGLLFYVRGTIFMAGNREFLLQAIPKNMTKHQFNLFIIVRNPL